MQIVSSTDVAIAAALRSNRLRVHARMGRFGEFVAISDDKGVIEVAADMKEAAARVDSIRAKIKDDACE